MLNEAQNRFITRVEGNAPAGALLKMYWQPIALSEDLAGPRPVKAVRKFGMDLVLFRSGQGLGLMERQCPHRGADLAFGRLEPEGLRCTFHGWLFTPDGQCVETPAEPPGSQLCKHIQQPAFPVIERSGLIFAYFGEGAPPPLPALDGLVAPDAYTFAFKGHLACNWLQALEVGIDPGHASFLHRFFEDENPEDNYGRQFRDVSAHSDLPITKVLREYDQPTINIEQTSFGMRLETLRELGQSKMHVRVTNVLFPNAFIIPMSPEVTITQWHVPVDDTNTYWYALFTGYGGPLDKKQMREQRLESFELPDYMPKRNKANNYGFDEQEQLSQTYTGMGHDINVHDQWAVESQGPIQDRTKEHLGQSDKGIVMYRRMLTQAIKDAQGGVAPLMVDAPAALAQDQPTSIDIVSPEEGWSQYWRQAEHDRREGAEWVRQAQPVA